MLGNHEALADRIPASEEVTSLVSLHTIGLLLAFVLAITSFWVAKTSVLWAPDWRLVSQFFAVAQRGVRLVFFLHITTGHKQMFWRLHLAFSSYSWSL